MHNRRQRLLWLLLLTLMLLLSTACSEQTPSAGEAAPTPQEVASAPEEEAEEVIDEEEGTASNENGEASDQETEEAEAAEAAEAEVEAAEAEVEVAEAEEEVAEAEEEAAEAEEEEETVSGEEILGFLTVSNQVGAKVFEFHLLLPESWKGVFEMQQSNDEAVSFAYTGSAEGREEVFSIEAMSESAWQEKQNEDNAGVGISSDRGIIFIYRVTRENPYQGEEGDTFQSMIDDVPSIITTFEARTPE